MNGTKAQVLVVEGDLVKAREFSKAVSNDSIGADLVSTGKEALLLLQQREIDVVIIPKESPEISGDKLLVNIKAISSRTEVIICAKESSVKAAVASIKAGAFDFLARPVQFEVLSASVDRAIESRRLKIAGALYQTSQAIFSTGDPESLPQIIVEVAMNVMQADDASLMMPDHTGTLYVEYSHALAGKPEPSSAPRGESIASKVGADRIPALFSQALSDDPRFSDKMGSGNVRSSIVYPLHSGDRLVGVLNLNRRSAPKPFRQADMESASVLASQATLALENSRLMGELRRRVSDLEQTQSRLAHTERLAGIGQLAAGVAHEINNPVSFLLTSIEHIEESVAHLQSASELLDREPVRGALAGWIGGSSAKVELEELMQSVKDGKEGAERIRDIAKDLRLLSRKDAPDMVRIDLNEAIRGAMRVARLSMGKSVELRCHLHPGMWVMALERRLSQVFVNLLVNAAQAVSNEGGEARWVDVKTGLRDEWVVASVSDCGPGIPPELMRRIFEPFFTTKPGESGTGLGLSISREIVEKHGGLISVDSTIGKGTTFEIRLPLASLL